MDTGSPRSFKSSFWPTLIISNAPLPPPLSEEDELDDDELMEASLLDLVREEYDKIVSVVTDGFGGNNQMFVSLWLSCNVRWSGKRKLPDEVIDETLNTLDENKLTGYEWVTTGCQIHLD
mgnify:CR=1 FL=1